MSAGWDQAGWIIIRISPAVRRALGRRPRPEAQGPAPAAPAPEGGSAMLVGGTPEISPRADPGPPTRPRRHAPGAGESRPWNDLVRGGGADHHNLAPDSLRPPSPEKNAPRASAVDDS